MLRWLSNETLANTPKYSRRNRHEQRGRRPARHCGDRLAACSHTPHIHYDLTPHSQEQSYTLYPTQKDPISCTEAANRFSPGQQYRLRHCLSKNVCFTNTGSITKRNVEAKISTNRTKCSSCLAFN